MTWVLLTALIVALLAVAAFAADPPGSTERQIDVMRAGLAAEKAINESAVAAIAQMTDAALRRDAR